MPWIIERKHDHVAVVTMNTNKVNAQGPMTRMPRWIASKQSSANAQSLSRSQPPMPYPPPNSGPNFTDPVQYP